VQEKENILLRRSKGRKENDEKYFEMSAVKKNNRQERKENVEKYFAVSAVNNSILHRRM